MGVEDRVESERDEEKEAGEKEGEGQVDGSPLSFSSTLAIPQDDWN